MQTISTERLENLLSSGDGRPLLTGSIASSEVLSGQCCPLNHHKLSYKLPTANHVSLERQASSSTWTSNTASATNPHKGPGLANGPILFCLATDDPHRGGMGTDLFNVRGPSVGGSSSSLPKRRQSLSLDRCPFTLGSQRATVGAAEHRPPRHRIAELEDSRRFRSVDRTGSFRHSCCNDPSGTTRLSR